MCSPRVSPWQDLVRQLNAQVLELKGNIRVFCRVRPLIQGEGDRLQLTDGKIS